MKNKEFLIEVSTTSLSPFMKDLRLIFTSFTTQNAIVKEEQYLKSYTKRYPGNYVLEEYMDSKLLKVLYRLRFETPEDKTMFLLRYD
jgi:hypothetical protein